MLSSIFTVALLAVPALAVEKRQATNAAQFTSAADELISKYIPSTALPALESAVASAASAASVAGEPLSLIYDGLLAMSMPGWFSSAIPADASTQIAALASKINDLRPATAGGVTVIAVTTTDSAGSTVTSSLTSTFPSSTVVVTTTSGVTATTTATTTEGTGILGAGAGSTLSTLTTEVINGATSVFSVAVSGGSSVVSAASSVLTTEVINGVTSVFSVAVSGGSSVASRASSVVSDASSGFNSLTSAVGGSTSTSTGGGSVPTGVAGSAAAAGVIGLLGLMAAL